MENETDVIRDQMLETRTALSDKLDALQNQVVSTVQKTTANVTETVQNVTEAVQDTVSNVTESVQDTVASIGSTLDITKHVEKYPWTAFGGAVLLGYLGANLLLSSKSGSGGSTAESPKTSNNGTSASATNGHPAAAGPQKSGSDWVGSLTESLGPVVSHLEELAVGTLAGVVGEMAMSSAPEAFRPQLKELINHVTTALGGTPIEGAPRGEKEKPQPEQQREEYPDSRVREMAMSRSELPPG